MRSCWFGVVCLAAWACGAPEQAAVWETTVDSLPGGIPHVVNTPRSHARAGWTIEEVLRVGSIDADGPRTFGGLRGLAVLDDDGFAVLDAIPQEVRVFDGEGRHRATFGGKGGGPGEFAAAHGLMRDDRGRLWIPDTRNARMSVFDPVRGFESAMPLSFLSYGFVWRGRMMDDGRIWKPSITLGPPRANLMRVYDSAMDLVDSLSMPPDPVVDPTDPPGAFYWEAADGRARAFFSVPFFPQGNN